MEENLPTPEPTVAQTSKTWMIVGIIFIVLSVLLSGVVVWQFLDVDEPIFYCEETGNAITEPDEVNVEEEGVVEDKNDSTESEATVCKYDHLDLPAVAFIRPGLLTDAEKAELNEKFINPFIAYESSDLTSLIIEVPSKNGEAYHITSVYSGEQQNGTGQFQLESRGSLNYWSPSCMGDCPFTEAFIGDYPEVIAEYNRLNKR